MDQGNTAANQDEAKLLSDMEIDVIGEVLNISMGAAATAVSNMLSRKAIITTPTVRVEKMNAIGLEALEPALLVKITYVEGISGSNVMVFNQTDMQIIINSLMGNEDPPNPDFVFDELSMSAACEVMNQMMGASATALADFLGKTINISTPTADVMSNDYTFADAMGAVESTDVVAVIFNLTIDSVINSEFVSVMTIDLAKEIIDSVLGTTAPEPTPPPMAVPVPAPKITQPQQVAQQAQMQQAQMQQAQMQQAQMQQHTVSQDPNAFYSQQQQGYQQQFYQQQPVQMQYAQPQYVPPQQPLPPQAPPMNLKMAQFPDFGQPGVISTQVMAGTNMDLILNVELDVAVEIGRTKKRIKDILEYTQGTVIELNKQAGAPVDIIVNGELIAKGDVVVIDDNFGVRITEILGTKELLNTI